MLTNHAEFDIHNTDNIADICRHLDYYQQEVDPFEYIPEGTTVCDHCGTRVPPEYYCTCRDEIIIQ